MTLIPSNASNERFSRYLEEGAADFFQRLRVPRGARILGIGCSGCPLARVAKRGGVAVVVADAASLGSAPLPFADAEFDVVTSAGGVMFAPQPEKVAAELGRVCRPGGTIALANWTADGFVGQMLQTAGVKWPLAWGEEASAGQLIGQHASQLRITRRLFPFEYPFPPASVVELFRENYGPVMRAFAERENNDRRALRAALDALWTRHNECTQGHTKVQAEYLEVVGTKQKVAGSK